MDTIVIGAGQSGLAAARALLQRGLTPVILEAGDEPTGSWASYYDSLTLFSPAAYSALSGQAFPGDPGHYPTRDEVVAYLRRYADSLGVEIRTGTRVSAVEPDGAGGFLVHPASGDTLRTRGVVAATGSFGNPYTPALPGQDGFTGQALHVAGYRDPKQHAGQRVVVVGGGNSAVQVAYELAEVATVTIASRRPLQLFPQVIGGKDAHYWHTTTGFDALPPHWLARIATGTLVLDTGDYAASLSDGRMDRRPMFSGFEGHQVVWADGSRESVDVVIYATGYLPCLGYLAPLGALDAHGLPLHAGGISITHPGLAYVGLEFQRSFASNTLRGVHRDAEHIAAPLAAYAGGALAAYGL
ncbi:flavin-containing monooxygenase [Nonomuraea gerenzanensis]|uniref:Putative monooxygenase n=1 Tax=Nonomuraea gerenzanensis TaxID=93944 RepID=A0A1M4DYP8_9ACTN|nr:NAD(P)/FAD-dependent oxidoreductase [Nonomuraea gerenzanensis]UBU14014.1 NAD(P)/FAD-dependent oxidoreductase [Nonomuraea gerenzanensis]SBO91699.1 Putative monooxygenase [Nonomuraea gerenzanensis]